MRIAGLIQDSIVDGPGFRFVVFTQGCLSHCEGCHNKKTWDLDGGTDIPVGDVIDAMLSNPLTDGLTLTGGEPFIQAADCVSLAAVARDKGFSIWIYTGYLFETLMDRAENEAAIKELIELTDVMIDGRFIKAERSLSLKWRGSRNQRVIDVQKSLKTGVVTLFDT